jgi:hypothetical protein
VILATPREIEVSRYLRAHRKRLRPVVEVRCRGDSRLLAAVYPLRDEFWVWHLGERYSPEQWRDEAESMMNAEPHDPIDGIRTVSDSASGVPMNSSTDNSMRTFPDAIFELRDPVSVYKSHTREQILTAYPSGPYASCTKCRASYVMDSLAIGYVTGDYVSNRSRERHVIHPARVSYCGDGSHHCEDHLTDDLPWNLAEACRSAAAAVPSSSKTEHL